MKIGRPNAILVGPVLVIRDTDVTWIVLAPNGDAVGVAEDPDGPGLLGEDWAVEAVRQAEQLFDRAAHPEIYAEVTG